MKFFSIRKHIRLITSESHLSKATDGGPFYFGNVADGRVKKKKSNQRNINLKKRKSDQATTKELSCMHTDFTFGFNIYRSLFSTTNSIPPLLPRQADPDLSKIQHPECECLCGLSTGG